jgi:DNA-binding NtrC family response regulator
MTREVDRETVPLESSSYPIDTVKVEVVDGPDRGKSAITDSSLMSIGTCRSNNLALSDDTVSRYHLELERKADCIALRDLGSTNGTVYRGVRLDRAEVPPGTILELGRTTIRIEDGATVRLELFGEEHLGQLIGNSPAMRQLMSEIERVARSQASVLVLGETGSGKEVVARTIHELSPRASGPLEIVDCASIPSALLASELFGHEAGAFTGADRTHAGALERADGGTLFLDEIGELPPSEQSFLLGALERRTFRRVGGREAISVDVRIIAATNRDLRVEVNRGGFRQDLYFRLAVVRLTVPPLRERSDDIPLLIDRFLSDAGITDVRAIFSDDVVSSMKRMPWHGNVRELKNTVDAAIALGEIPHLEGETRGPPIEMPYTEARARALERFDADYVSALLEITRGNVSEAARRAKVSRSYLTRLIRRRKIQRAD